MRFSIIERDSDYFFEDVRESLEKLVKGNDMFQPLTELRENEHEYNVKIQLPGVTKEEINVELTDNSLIVTAENKMDEAKDDESIHISEFSYGKFVKSINFDKELDAEKSTSEYKNGILNIILKKREEKKPETKRLTVN